MGVGALRAWLIPYSSYLFCHQTLKYICVSVKTMRRAYRPEFWATSDWQWWCCPIGQGLKVRLIIIKSFIRKALLIKLSLHAGNHQSLQGGHKKVKVDPIDAIVVWCTAYYYNGSQIFIIFLTEMQSMQMHDKLLNLIDLTLVKLKIYKNAHTLS